MKFVIALLLIATSHFQSFAHADHTESFINKLKATQINGIEAALIRLGLFAAQENKKIASKQTQLMFIYTNNKLELSVFIKKEKPSMNINECRRYLRSIKGDYNATKLSRIAFADYSVSDQKTAKSLFAYQILLVDQVEPDIVMSCR